MSPSWIWSNKITNERVARVGYNLFISNMGEWNNCFSKFSNRVLPPIFISTILQSVQKEKTSRTIFHYIITQVILAFWLVLAYDLLEDRCTIDVIITESLPQPF